MEHSVCPAVFQQMGGLPCEAISAEITDGTERLATLLQGTTSIWKLEYAHGVTYAESEKQVDLENCFYNFEEADTQVLSTLFDAALSVPLSGQFISTASARGCLAYQKQREEMGHLLAGKK